MTTESLRQQNLGPLTAVMIMTILLLTISAITNNNPLEGVSGGHSNHTDTQSTILPGNTCPNGCPWPDCGCSDSPQLTLQPTVYISPIATFDPAITPDIPDPVNNATVFPTLQIDPLPTIVSTMMIPTLMPFETPQVIPTIEPSIRDVDRPDGSGGGLD